MINLKFIYVGNLTSKLRVYTFFLQFKRQHKLPSFMVDSSVPG